MSYLFKSRHLVEITISFISEPYAPAFILTAPPIVPGIPEANSKPVIPFCKSICARTASFTPAPTATITLSSLVFSFSISTSSNSILATIPLIPLFLTKMLLPLPITVICTSFFLATFIICFNSSMFFTFTNISAFPPTLKVVCLLIGSFIYICSEGISLVNSWQTCILFKLKPPNFNAYKFYHF